MKSWLQHGFIALFIGLIVGGPLVAVGYQVADARTDQEILNDDICLICRESFEEVRQRDEGSAEIVIIRPSKQTVMSGLKGLVKNALSCNCTKAHWYCKQDFDMLHNFAILQSRMLRCGRCGGAYNSYRQKISSLVNSRKVLSAGIMIYFMVCLVVFMQQYFSFDSQNDYVKSLMRAERYDECIKIFQGLLPDSALQIIFNEVERVAVLDYRQAWCRADIALLESLWNERVSEMRNGIAASPLILALSYMLYHDYNVITPLGQMLQKFKRLINRIRHSPLSADVINRYWDELGMLQDQLDILFNEYAQGIDYSSEMDVVQESILDAQESLMRIEDENAHENIQDALQNLRRVINDLTQQIIPAEQPIEAELID